MKSSLQTEKARQQARPTGGVGRGPRALCGSACLLGISLLTVAHAQTGGREILAGSGALSSGVALQYRTVAVGSGALPDSIGGGFRIEGDKLYRLLVDKPGRLYLGYQLAVADGPSSGAYLVSIEPLTGIEDLLRLFAPGAIVKPAPAPRCPKPQIVRDGDTIALDLMTSPDGKQKITDAIRILSHTPAEVTTLDAPVTFKSTVNMVSVPVVVRDAQGRSVGDLSRDDFQLSDGGRPQIVSRFSVETPASPASAPGLPDRYVAYLFDDLHLGYPDDDAYSMGVQDMERARDAAWRYIESSTPPHERAALYTTSGLIGVDFTADRERLRKALMAVRALGSSKKDPNYMSFWKADQVVNKNNLAVLRTGVAGGGSPAPASYGDADTELRARRSAGAALEFWNRDTRAALTALEGAIAKLSTMPGQRAIVLVSPGFLVLSDSAEWETRIVDRAIRAGVAVSALDVKGVPGRLDPSIAADERAVMADLAAGTGGRLVEGTNGLERGFALAAGSPEAIYILGFVPRDLKLDGRYHALKVTLRNSRGLTVEARRGYYSPRYADSPAEQAKKAIEEAFFSTAEVRELPVAVETQFFKTGSDEATVDVLAKVDVRRLPFRKEDGRNRNDVTVVSGLFDRDGNYVSGTQKVLEMRLKDETLASRLNSGIAVRASFKVKPGSYTVRTVVRDSEGQSLTALSAAMEIQ